MLENISPEKSRSFIEKYFDPTIKDTPVTFTKPAVTISREEGAGGLSVASELADYLKQHTLSHEEWTVFSHHLVAKVLEDHNQQKHIANFMKEDHKGALKDAFEEFLGLHPSTWTLVEQTNATILRLAQIGNVILVGRGGNIVTSEMETAFHVRLVAPFEKRIQRAEEILSLDRKAAVKYIKKKDGARRRYVKDHFDKEIDDPLLYHIIINTDMIPYSEAARIIGDEMIRRYNLGRPVKKTGSINR